jgi:hypothetical protein
MPNVVWKAIDVNEQWTVGSIVMLYREDDANETVQARYIDYIRRFVDQAPCDHLAAAARPARPNAAMVG